MATVFRGGWVATLAGLVAGCGETTHSQATVQPPPVHQFPADAAPPPDADRPAYDVCGPHCATGACDEGTCHHCVFVVDPQQYPDGRVIALRTHIPILCLAMPPSSAVTVSASGDVSTEDRCTHWRASLRISSRRHGVVGSLNIDAHSEEVYPVHLEGVTASDADGKVDLALEVTAARSNVADGCSAIRFHPDFTVTVSTR